MKNKINFNKGWTHQLDYNALIKYWYITANKIDTDYTNYLMKIKYIDER